MKSPFATTAESESTGTGLAVPLGDVGEVFKPNGSLPFIQAVRQKVVELKPKLDPSTHEGKELIISTAYKVTKTKTYAFGKAKTLADSLKSRAKEIMLEAEFMSGELAILARDTRQPVTDLENKDAARNGEFETRIGEIYDACLFVGAPSIEIIQARMAKLRGYQSIAWYEYSDRAMEAFKQSIPALEAMLEVAEKAEADRVELEELRALKANLSQAHYAPNECFPGTSHWQLCEHGVNVAEGDWCGQCNGPIDGEAIPPRGEKFPDIVATSQTDLEGEAFNDLADIIDLDRAADVLEAIKAGKIRHVQIVY